MARRLYRSVTDKVLFGVCGGLADYFDIDSVIVRFIWILFTCMGGAGFLIYIIAALIMPKQPFYDVEVEYEFDPRDK